MTALEQGQNRFRDAASVRARIATAASTETPVEFSFPSPVAACILGLPKEIFDDHFSLLMIARKGQVQVLVADSQDIALQAFRTWRNDTRPESAEKHTMALYLSMYRLIQAHNTRSPEVFLRELHDLSGVLLKVQGEIDDTIRETVEYAESSHQLLDDDIIMLHGLINNMWGQFSEEEKRELKRLGGFTPENVFANQFTG